MPYLCTRFRERGREGEEVKTRGRKKSLKKKLEKNLEIEKQTLPLQPLSRGGAGRDDREREKMKEEFFKILR